MGRPTCAQSYDTAAFCRRIAFYCLGNMGGKVCTPVVGGFKNTGIDFFFACKCGKLDFVARSIVAACHPVELYLRAEICFHM